MHFLSLPILAILTSFLSALSEAIPLVVPWNTTHSYGPDGPWSVVTVQVGSSDVAGTHPMSTVDLYPGGVWESIIIRGAFCDTNGTAFSDGSGECFAEKAGLYNMTTSKTVLQHITDAVGLVWQWASNEADYVSGMAVNVLDTIRIPSLHGSFAVYNSTISAVQAWQIALPDGTLYSTQVGTLSLGAPGMGIQQFYGSTIGQTVPGYAYAQGLVASNSWGLHYGSASLHQEGSLVFGGYDQSRVLGDVGAFDLDWAMMPNLLDIQIGVENGASPFSETSYNGLLKLNTSFNGVQPAVINPIVPYLFMSPQTCAAITENLPVVLNSQVGLYIWNTTDPQYELIVKSPAYLAFVFQRSGSGNLTIKVPFRLLNLTLEAPIVTTTQQYFPCRPFQALDGSGNYFLGKAFLQATFIGMNWQEEKFFLAQAPGPGVGASNIRSMGPNDTMIGSDPIENFAATWASEWVTLSDSGNNGNPTAFSTINGTKGTSESDNDRNASAFGTSSGPTGTSENGNGRNLTATSSSATNGQKSASSFGLSSRAKAGIAVGVVVSMLAVAVVVLLYRMRGHPAAVTPQERVLPKKQGIWVYEKDGETRIPEIGNGLPHEADNDRTIYELGIREGLS